MSISRANLSPFLFLSVWIESLICLACSIVPYQISPVMIQCSIFDAARCLGDCKVIVFLGTAWFVLDRSFHILA
jgi:hypothetical protein